MESTRSDILNFIYGCGSLHISASRRDTMQSSTVASLPRHRQLELQSPLNLNPTD